MTTSRRLARPADSSLNSAQREAIDEISRGPRAGVFGPFEALLGSPELMTRVQKVGEFLRFGSSLSDVALELVILTVARHWDQSFEWGYHRPLALKAGLSAAAVAAVERGETPSGVAEELTDVWTLVRLLLTGRDVGDDLYERLAARWEDQGIVELVTTVGYYTTLALVLNTARTPAPNNGQPPLAARQERTA